MTRFPSQCLAELVAVEFLNNNPEKPVYGIVTDGKLWEFGRLIGKDFTRNIESLTINELPKLFGALKFIFDEATKDLD